MTIVHRVLNLNWIAVFFFPLTVVLIEVFWLYPWLVWIGRWPVFNWQRLPFSLASLIFLTGISFLVTRLFLGRRWSLPWVRFGIVSCGLVTAFLIIRIEYGAGFELLGGEWFVNTGRVLLGSFSHLQPMMVALAVAAYLWWRGISLGRSPLQLGNVYHSFTVGLIALVVLIVVWGVSLGTGSLQGLTSTVGLYVAGFFFFSLIALALSHLQTIRQEMLEREEMAQVPGRRWLYIMLVVAGGIVFLGMGTAGIFSPELVALLKHLWSATYEMLLQVMYYVFIPIGYLAEGLFYVAQFIVNLLRRGQSTQPVQQTRPAKIEGAPEEVPLYALPENMLIAIKWGVFAIIAGVVIFWLLRAILRYRSFQAQAEIEETSESLWSWAGFKADLLLFLNMILRRLERKKKVTVAASSAPTWYSEEDIQGRLGIREIYRRLLWEAAYSGIARRRHETPHEYAKRFGQTMPGGGEPVGELTDIYINVRYGDIEADDKQVDCANRLWEAIRSRLTRPAQE